VDLPSVFNRAADIIAANGLTKDAFFNADWPGAAASAPVDLVGALRIATCGSPDVDCPMARLAVQFISLNFPGVAPVTDDEPDYVEHIAWWNDLPDVTQADVVTRLRELAALADQAVAA
jgi:hypothetical protein